MTEHQTYIPRKRAPENSSRRRLFAKVRYREAIKDGEAPGNSNSGKIRSLLVRQKVQPGRVTFDGYFCTRNTDHWKLWSSQSNVATAKQ